jgi:hypothetical protein
MIRRVDTDVHRAQLKVLINGYVKASGFEALSSRAANPLG